MKNYCDMTRREKAITTIKFFVTNGLASLPIVILFFAEDIQKNGITPATVILFLYCWVCTFLVIAVIRGTRSLERSGFYDHN